MDGAGMAYDEGPAPFTLAHYEYILDRLHGDNHMPNLDPEKQELEENEGDESSEGEEGEEDDEDDEDDDEDDEKD